MYNSVYIGLHILLKGFAALMDRMNNTSMWVLPKLVENQNEILLDKSNHASTIYIYISESFYICVTSRPLFKSGVFTPATLASVNLVHRARL